MYSNNFKRYHFCHLIQQRADPQTMSYFGSGIPSAMTRYIRTALFFFQSELGAWSEDGPSAWDDDLSEREIASHTERVLREGKQAERERRALEQQRKKEERDVQRAARKGAAHLGIKVAS